MGKESVLGTRPRLMRASDRAWRTAELAGLKTSPPAEAYSRRSVGLPVRCFRQSWIDRQDLVRYFWTHCVPWIGDDKVVDS